LQAVAAELGVQPEDFCDFSSNINPLGPPPGLCEELQKNLLADLRRYPVPQARVFRDALATFLGIPVERLLIGNGASELIHLLFLWARPQRVAIPFPTFSEYERAAKLAGAEVQRFPLSLETSCLEADKIKKLLTWGDFIVFCNPNNPTGMFYAPEKIREIVREAADKGVTVLVDESFFFLTARSFKELFLGRDYPNLWTAVSLTKLWALPGLRLGVLAGPAEGIKKLTSQGDPWRVNALAQRAGLYCLQQKDYIARSLKMIYRERDYLLKNLGEIKSLKVFPGEANYLLVKGEEKDFSSAALFQYLAAKGILIRNAANFPGLDQRYFRIAVLQRENNRRLLQALKNYFQSTGGGR